MNLVDTLVPDSLVMGDDQNINSMHEMWKGRKFSNRDSFREALAKAAMYDNFAMKRLRTSPTEVTARCSESNCPWRIHATLVNSGPEFQVRTYNGAHTCSKPMMGLGHGEATSRFIAMWIIDRLRIHESYTPKEIITDFSKEFGVQLSYKKAWKAREIALDEIRGSYEQSFSILPDYCHELRRTNPSTVTHVIQEEDSTFCRFFFSLG